MFLDGGMRCDLRHEETAVENNLPARLQQSGHDHGVVRKGAPCQSDS